MSSHFAKIELAQPETAVEAVVETGKSSFAPIENTRCRKNAETGTARPDGRQVDVQPRIYIGESIYVYIHIYTYRAAQSAREISRDESTRGAISGVCFAPGSQRSTARQFSPAKGQRGTRPGWQRRTARGRLWETRSLLLLPLYSACIFNARVLCLPPTSPKSLPWMHTRARIDVRKVRTLVLVIPLAI